MRRHEETLRDARGSQMGLEGTVRDARGKLESVRATLEDLRVREASLKQDAEHLRADFREHFETEIPETYEVPEEPLEELEVDLERMKNLLHRMGPINELAAEEFDEQEERHICLGLMARGTARPWPSFLGAVGVLLPILLAFACRGDRVDQKPNVVLVVVDTLRADHLSFYGYPKETAPFLAQLASRSLVFENAVSTSSWTCPATASIFTSLYPVQHSVVEGRRGGGGREESRFSVIPQGVETLAEVFSAAGYTTFAVSDNPNVNPLNTGRGFDHFALFLAKGAERVNERIFAWREMLSESAPFLLYVHYMDPHSPYQRRSPWYEPDDDPLHDTIAAYDSEISYLDSQLGELFHAFGWEDALVMVTADHGEEFLDHGRREHGKTLYQEVLRVPLLIRLPNRRTEAARIDVPASLIDVLPTLRGFLGLPPGAQDRGVDLLHGISTSAESRPLVSHLSATRDTHDPLRAILSGDWKLIAQGSERELYNLVSDPQERTNLASELSDQASDLAQHLDRAERSLERFSPEFVDLTPEIVEKLKALGYVD